MQKPITLFFLFLLQQLSFSQSAIEYWDIAQTQKKSEQQMKNAMQHGKFVAWYANGEIAKEGTFFEDTDDLKNDTPGAKLYSVTITRITCMHICNAGRILPRIIR